MTNVPRNPKRFTDPWVTTKQAEAAKPEATVTDPTIRKLLGPKGETLRTFSDRPPVGFHQGERDPFRPGHPPQVDADNVARAQHPCA